MRAISLGNTAFEGLNNAYLLEGEVTTLVDTGVATDTAREQLTDGLSRAGYDVGDVEQVLLTHFHADHAGLAGEIQDAGGAVVRAHEADAALAAGEADAREDLKRRQRAALERWGMPDDPRKELLAFLERGEGIEGRPADVEAFTAGDRFAAGDRTLEAVNLPGHTAGLCGFVAETDYRSFTGAAGRELFCGDALLPYYTPNVGGADVRVERPLANYLDTLAGVVEAEYARAWPGHRGPIVDPAGRAADIVAHHRERTDRVLSVLREHGPADAWTVSAHLFGGLSNVHILHGPGEASAHLDHLAAAGVLTAEEVDGARRYGIADPGADLDALFPLGIEREYPDPSA